MFKVKCILILILKNILWKVDDTAGVLEIERAAKHMIVTDTPTFLCASPINSLDTSFFFGLNMPQVCIARNPKDVAVSLYKHTTAIPAHDYRGNWDAFLELFFKGHVCEGSWFDHTVGWWEASQKSAHKDQIFWIYFEDLKKDPAPVITALAAFLGVACDAKVLSKVMHASSFETMAESTAAQGNASAEAKSRFANGGHSGRWRKHFSEAQNAAMDALYAAKVNERTAPGLRFDFG